MHSQTPCAHFLSSAIKISCFPSLNARTGDLDGQGPGNKSYRTYDLLRRANNNRPPLLAQRNRQRSVQLDRMHLAVNADHEIRWRPG